MNRMTDELSFNSRHCGGGSAIARTASRLGVFDAERDRRWRAAAVMAVAGTAGCGGDPMVGPLRDEATLDGQSIRNLSPPSWNK